MSGMIMVTGGSRSGKSAYAEELCILKGENLAYIATANLYDAEMEHRVAIHKARRGPRWDSFEIPLHFDSFWGELEKYDFILLDCLTMLIFNMMFDSGYNLDDPKALDAEVYKDVEDQVLSSLKFLFNKIASLNATFVIVTNEIGLGIVPGNVLSRLYRDIVGKANQYLAEMSSEVILVVSGIPLKIKGS